jgi:hypothetical protein
MENAIARKTKMYDKTDYVFIKYDTVWGSNVSFKENVVLFRSHRGQVTVKINEQSSSKSSSAKKKMALDTLIDLTLLVCNIGVVYASEKNDTDLRVQFNFSKSDLKKGIEAEICKQCIEIGKNAETILSMLLPYGLPANQLTLLTAAVDDYAKLISLPESVINTSKSSKNEMIDLIALCDEILKNRLDKLMLLFKDTHHDFYTEYFNARYIGGWHKKNDGEVEGSEEEAVV